MFRLAGRRRWLALFAVMIVAAFVGGASAATQPKSETRDFKGSALKTFIDTGDPLSPDGLFCDPCLPDGLMNFLGKGGEWALGGRVSGGLKIDWTNPVSYDMKYTDSLVRQGETLDMSDMLTTQGGHVAASVVVNGFIATYRKTDENPAWHPDDDIFGTPLGGLEMPVGAFDCTIPLPGNNPNSCQAWQSDKIKLACFPLFGVVEVCLQAQVTITFTSSGTPITSLRVATTAGDDSGGLQQPLSFTPTSPVTLEDHFKVPCTEPAGMDFFYKLSDNHYTALGPHFGGHVTFALAVDTPIEYPGPDVELPVYTTPELEPEAARFDDMSMTAPDIVANLGQLQPDNRPPALSNLNSPNGDEGSQIQLHVDATDNCGAPAVRWDFSDGGVAFGNDPKHTFADDGHYTGLVTATDDTGNTTRRNFALDLANVKPSVNAGPDATDDWGRAVAFNGQATDPGAADQSTLQYTWSFGDGTPSASGGPSVSHAYAAPGIYTATLKVCDKNGLCDSDTRDVVVTKRDTSLGYLGDTSAAFDTPATLSASLVDEYGQTVNGRTITFNVGSDGPLTALTNSSGVVVKSYTPTLGANSYTGSSAFVGDSLYNLSNSSNGFSVSRKATATTYTGATTGGPNKTIVLSAVLKDATGKALAGKTISFQIGSQSASAVTNSSGVAAASLQLNQKNGTYTVSATYAGDASYYVGSGQSTVFKLQAK